MFDIGAPELFIVAVLAIIVVGPKDLPRLMRTLGQWLGKARAMAREFQKSFDDIAREAELDELRQQVESLRETNPIGEVKKALDPTGSLEAIEKEAKGATKDPANEATKPPTPEVKS